MRARVSVIVEVSESERGLHVTLFHIPVPLDRVKVPLSSGVP